MCRFPYSLPVSGETAGVVSITRIERPGGLDWSPTARIQRGSSEIARCTSTGDHLVCPLILLPSLLVSLFEGCLIDSQLRAANESLLFFLLPHLKEEGRWSLPARIEGPLFYRGASASRKDRLTIPFSSLVHLFLFKSVAWIGPQLRTSNGHSFIVGVP